MKNFPYFLLSASWGSVPGRVTVTVVGELTSYLLCGFLHNFILTRQENIEFEITAIKGWNWLGKKLKKNKLILITVVVSPYLHISWIFSIFIQVY